MFVLTDDLTFWWPVTVYVPDTKTPGRLVGQTFDVKFKSLAADRARELKAQFDALEGSDQRDAHQDWLATEVTVDWRKIVDENKEEIPFSSEALSRALQYSWFRIGIYNAWTDATWGSPKTKAARGN